MSATSSDDPQRAAAVIPARYRSQRLPGKPLARVGGLPLIEHVWRRVRAAATLDRVVVATDDQRIADAVKGFGGEVWLTRPDHASGTDRIGELLPRLPEPLILNVQGDEPEIETSTIDALVERLRAQPELLACTAATPWPKDADPADPNRVKVVLDRAGRALYFSRSPLPGGRAGAPVPERLLHLGIYAFRREALVRFLSLPPGELEQAESLEQLRLLENGLRIGVVVVPRGHGGIDTPEDLEAFRGRLETGLRGARH